GYQPEDYRLTNAIRCKTPRVNKIQLAPTPFEINTCRVHLKNEIHERKPRLIIALGDTALQSLCKTSGIKAKRGNTLPLHPDFEYECEVWPTYHSAFVQKVQPMRGTVVADLRKIRDSGMEREAIEWCWANFGHSIVGQHFDRIAWDIETDFDFITETGGDNITQIGIACGDHTIVSRDAMGSRLIDYAIRAKTLVTHNGWSFDVPKMHEAGTNVPWGDDTQVLAYLEDENQPQSLESLCVKFLGVRGWKDERVATQGTDEFALYNARDAHYTLRLHEVLLERLGERKRIADVIMLTEWKGLLACSKRGVYISKNAVDNASAHYGAKVEEKRAAVLAEAQTPLVNPNSNDQVAAELTQRGYYLPPTPTGGLSVAIDVLNELDDPFVDAMKDYRKARDMMKYVKQYYPIVASEERRAHSEYTITRASTGRALSRKMRADLPRDPIIRAFHSAPEGFELMSVDYASIEFRIAAWIAGERVILDRYHANPKWDPHRFVGSYLYSKPENEVTDQERNDVCKSANFGLLFLTGIDGLQEYMLGKGIRMPWDECARIYRVWHDLFPAFGEPPSGPTDTLYGQAAKIMRFIKQHGYIESPIGRRRNFGDVKRMNYAEKTKALREAYNQPVQATTHDIAGLGLALCHDAGLPVCAFLHDDIKFEFPIGTGMSHLEQITSLMVDEPLRIIEQTFGVRIDVPLLVDAKVIPGARD
ncbi:MAG: DNA polymerase, partial [Aliidongia sp.]